MLAFSSAGYKVRQRQGAQGRLPPQLTAKALIRVSAERRAEQLLKLLVAKNSNDEESIGLLARIYKNLWLQSGDPEDARRARDAYLPGRASGGHYTLINAATLSRVFGEDKRASVSRTGGEPLPPVAGGHPLLATGLPATGPR